MPLRYAAAANESRKLLTDIVLTATDTRDAGRAMRSTKASINCTILRSLEANIYCANAYATIDDAKLKTLIMANNFVFCAESFGTSVANVATTTVNSTPQIANVTYKGQFIFYFYRVYMFFTLPPEKFQKTPLHSISV